MIKFVKIIFVNFFLFVFLFCLTDYILIVKNFYNPYFVEYTDSDRLENTLKFDGNKKSIILAGCSFTYGSGINADENMSYKLQKLTNRKVYNRGIESWGPNANLKDIQTSPFFNNREIIEPEYYIYTFISDHLRRIYIDYWETNPFNNNKIYNLYTIRNNKLILKEKVNLLNYIQNTYLIRRLNRAVFDITPDNNKFDRLKLYLYEIKKELEKRYPNIKMVIIVYYPELDTKYTHEILPFRTERWKEFEDDGFIVIRFDKSEFEFLNENSYISPNDNIHPSGKAWDTLVPIIINKLKL